MIVCENPLIRMFNADSMQAMADMEDNAYDLAIVDPEYGRKEHGGKNRSGFVKQHNGSKLFVRDGNYKKKSWDNMPAGEDYFKELLRVTENQIIWGVNNFDYLFGKGRIVWDKVNGDNDQFDCELAYQSLNDRVDLVRYMWSGTCQGKSLIEGHIQQGNKKLNEKRIHPTQKPILLYRWVLQRYATAGDRILDTHGGSGSIAIACWDMGFDLDWYETDADYYGDAVGRFKEHIKQPSLFRPEHKKENANQLTIGV